MPFEKALEIAKSMMEDLQPYCERIQIAGSLRRRRPEVGDIEMVAIPKLVQGVDLFGGPGSEQNLLEDYLHTFDILRGGDHYKKIRLASIEVDLFITTPEQWGVIFLLRTGSAEFSHWFVTRRCDGGGLPSHMRIQDGRLWIGGQVADTPEESDLFEKTGICWVSPNERER